MWFGFLLIVPAIVLLWWVIKRGDKGPNKYGPDSNDLALQLRKRTKSKVILAGMSANLCVESHLRGLLEQGFDVTVVKDATAAARHPQLGDGYPAAITNYGFIANGVVTTDEAVEAMKVGK